MKEVKSPILAKAKKRTVVLPPQKSAADTSNWENRNVSAQSIDKVTNKRIVRNVDFVRVKHGKDDPSALTLAQLEKLDAKDQAK